jgi:hypothetical protein
MMNNMNEEHKTDGTPCPCDPKRIKSFDVVVTNDSITMSDGFHTFDELYEHRIQLFIQLCFFVKNARYVWRSKFHSDGSALDDWFVLGIGENKGSQITYHLPVSNWEQTNFAETLNKAPEWDGHTSEDVLERLKIL